MDKNMDMNMSGNNKNSLILSVLRNNMNMTNNQFIMKNIINSSVINDWNMDNRSMSTSSVSTIMIMDNTIPTFPTDQFQPDDDIMMDMSRCYSSPDDYDLTTATISATLMVFGVLLVFYGYRCLKAVLFLVGFIFACTLIYLICLVENLLPQLGNASISLLAGLLFALITMLVGYVGLFMLGFHLGLLSCVAAFTSIYLIIPFIPQAMAFNPPTNPWILFAIFMSSGLTGACGNLYFQKGFSILATVIYGSTLTLLCVDYYIENFKLLFWFRDKLRDGNIDVMRSPGYPGYGNELVESDLLTSSVGSTRSTSLCTISWVLMSAWLVFVMLGLVIQWCLTSKGIIHLNDYNYGMVSSVTASRNTSQSNLNRLRVENESKMSEQKQKEYRYWYQVRRTHGDVLSRQCLQSLQKKKTFCPNDDSLTYASDLSSHLTIIPADSRNTTMSIA